MRPYTLSVGLLCDLLLRHILGLVYYGRHRARTPARVRIARMIPYSVSLRSIVHADACFFDASIASPAGEGRAAIQSRRLTALIACLSAKNPTTCSRSESLNPSSAAIAESERQSRSDLPLSFSRFNARSSLKPSFSWVLVGSAHFI